ncbi:hypothetical protein GE061_018913 [Apolygus lucorum]|uniref:Uncharacterized protein n=2 Tax=Mirini TaxID=236659 RepID=A0A8S9X8X2_APOLU|nr:hypothetical protein GE061_018913 [Apolygus lucorum]
MSGEGGTSCEVELVSCSLSELSSCLCLHGSTAEEGSSRRKRISDQSDFPLEEIFLTAKRAILRHKPTLIDHLIYRNRSALVMGPKKARGAASNAGVKRKRDPDPSSSTTAKKVKVNQPTNKDGSKKSKNQPTYKVDPLKMRTLKKKGNTESGTNRKSSRISSNKRVPISLRSGKKLAEKKKRIEERKKLKNEKDSNSNLCSNDANGVKSEDESHIKKEGSASVKKDGVGSKKTAVAKKDISNQAKLQLATNKAVVTKKAGNKPDAGGSDATSVTNEVEVMKKRKKRKRCSMYVRKYKSKDKRIKESGTMEETGDSVLEDDDDEDDDDAGRASDVSLMSSTTQESTSLPGSKSSGVEEKPSVENLQASEEADEDPPVLENDVKAKSDVKVEEVDAQVPAVKESLLEVPPVKESVQEMPFVKERSLEVPFIVDFDQKDAETCSALNDNIDKCDDGIEKQSCELSEPEAPVLHGDVTAAREATTVVCSDEVSVKLVCDDGKSIPLEVQEITSLGSEKANVGDNVDIKVENDVTTICSPPVSDEPAQATEVMASADNHVSTPSNEQSEAQLLPSEGNLSSEETSDVVPIKCDSLVEENVLECMNTPVLNGESMTENAILPDLVEKSNDLPTKEEEVGCSKDDDLKTNEREVTDLVPSSVDKNESVPQDSSSQESEELKRDADSTTCDNPRGLDDSFGDLSLYVSEDDLSHGKEHDEGLPDSTNITQVDAPSENDVIPPEARLSEDSAVKAEDLMETSLMTDVKTEKEELVENLTEEQKLMKESVLQALGLKSLSSVSNEVPEEKPPKRSDGYTGTLKAVIKLNRTGDKKHMVYKRSEDDLATSNKLEYRICSEISTDEKTGGETKKLPTEPNAVLEEDSTNEDGTTKESKLIIPEKSSSFSIHPGRLCSDVCSYCFGKFGSLDTPCHVAQLKGEDRQRKILENEPHLTGESCLCDACYRYVDRKANFPEKLKVGRLKPPAQASVCCVTHCSEPATRTIKRKWLIKLKKSITNKLNIDMEKLGHGVYYPFCTQHHYWVEYFTVCGICRKRLNRNNLFSLGAEADRLNLMLAEDGIPARLSVNLFLCKLCRYYADLRLKYPDPTAIPSSNQNFYKNYRRKILMSLDIPVSDSDDELLQPQDDETKKKLEGADDSKTDEDVMSLSGLATLLGEQPQQQARIQVKFGNVNIGTLSNLNIGQQGGSAASSATTSGGSASASTVHGASSVNGSSSHHKNEPTYPEVSLTANFEYQGPNTPDGSWERYQSTLQFDKKTKQLWTELQRPYGSQTSFLRHLVMLERVWRDGYLVLANDADEAASRYITSARNRIKAFETQGPKMQTNTPPVTTAPVAPVVAAPPTTSVPVSRPSPNVTVRKPPTQSFPFLTNTGEIEVTPIRTNKPSPTVHQHTTAPPSKTPTIQQRLNLPIVSQRSTGAQQFSVNNQHQLQVTHQLMNHPRKITPLDRAKSLVRMAPLYQQIQQHTQGSGEKRGGPAAVRFMGAGHSSIPPLVRLPQTQPTQFYSQPHQIYHPSQQQIQHQPPAQQRVALPKLPRNLTVVSMPARPSLPQAITLSHAGITIEKQIAPSRTSSLPIERPSISVFREPATP